MLIPSGTVHVTPDASLSLLGMPGSPAPDCGAGEPPVLRWMERLSLPPGAIWDFGGGAALPALLLGLAWPRNRVLAFAPPEELDLLRVNLVHAGAHGVSACPLPPAGDGWLNRAAARWPGRAAEPDVPVLLRFDLGAPLLPHWQDALDTLDTWDSWLLLRTPTPDPDARDAGPGSASGSGFGSGSGSCSGSGSDLGSCSASCSGPSSGSGSGPGFPPDSGSGPAARDSLAGDLLRRGYALVAPLGSAHLLARRFPA